MNKDEFKNYHGVDLLDFQKYIESIGFKYIAQVYTTDTHYRYKDYMIYLSSKSYDFHDLTTWWWDIDIEDLSPIENLFKKELRSFKLKQIVK